MRLFAILRDRAGVAEVELEMPDAGTVSDAAARLAGTYPTIADYLPRIAYAVNREYAAVTTELHDGDELALIPAVSGG